MSENARRENRIQGIVDRVSSEDDFDSIKWITQAPVQTFCRSAVDETVQKNAELHRDLGIQAKIVRTTVGENCKWCDNLAGTYDYEEVKGTGNPVFQRHDDCDCIVEYLPGDGRVQDVWSKEWREAPEDLEARKDYGLKAEEQVELEKLKDVLTPAEYNELVDILKQPGNEDFLRAYVEHADEISSILRRKGRGVFRPANNTIEFDINTEEGRDAFSTLVHEYGHFFDQALTNDTLTFAERDAIVEALVSSGKFSRKYVESLFPKDLSQSDQFLSAVRASKNGIKLVKEEAQVETMYGTLTSTRYALQVGDKKISIDEVLKTNNSAGMQDALDGMFGRKNIGVRWGHGERYYKRLFSAIKNRAAGIETNGVKEVQAALKDLGFDVSSQAKVNTLLRDHVTAREMWANMNSDVILGTEGAELFSEIFPEAYNIFKEIMKNAY